MDSFVPVLGISMMVFGLIVLVGGIGLLIYATWLRYKVEPPYRAAAQAVTREGDPDTSMP